MECTYSCAFILFILFNVSVCSDDELSCRDNEGYPVDWWYLYKPPSEDLQPWQARFDYQYFYISAKETDKRWQSGYYDIDKSMLIKTLAPLYKISSLKKLAVTTFTQRKARFPGDPPSSDIGLLMADGQGGVYLGHTLPGYPDLDADFPKFPPQELSKGHLFVCLSLTLISVNKLAELINLMAPRFLHTRIPPYLGQMLPDWKFKTRFLEPKPLTKRMPGLNAENETFWDRYYRRNLDKPTLGETRHLHFTIVTKGGSSGLMLYKRGLLSDNLYRRFAIAHLLVLDVYGHTREPVTSECTHPYSIRSINQISIKQPEDQTAIYMTKSNDMMRFAVNTAAHWQQNGSSTLVYWTCTSNLDKEDKHGHTGMMLCMNHYQIWNSFDNLKAHEPTCF